MPDRRKNTYRLAQSQIGHPHDRFSQLLSSASCRPSGLAILTYILIRQDSISSPQVSLSACKAQSKRIVPVGSGQRPFTHLWFRYSRTSRPTQAPALTSALDSTSTQSSARESGYFKISGFLSDAPYLSKREDCPLPFWYVGLSLPDITQSMRFVPFLQPFQRFWMTLRTRIRNSTSSRSERRISPLSPKEKTSPFVDTSLGRGLARPTITQLKALSRLLLYRFIL